MFRASLSVVFAGSGGSGAMTAGTLLLRSAARAGYYGLMRAAVAAVSKQTASLGDIERPFVIAA